MAVMRVVSKNGKVYYRKLKEGEISNTKDKKKTASTKPTKTRTKSSKIDETFNFKPIDNSKSPEILIIGSTLEPDYSFVMKKYTFPTNSGSFTGYRVVEKIKNKESIWSQLK